MKVDGECHCGFIKYEADADPAKVFVCHCSDCQSISGSPFRWGISIPEEDFTLISGQPKTYTKIGESGRQSHQLFCPECASPIYAYTEGSDPKMVRLRLGTCRQRAQLEPKTEVWCRSSQTWLQITAPTTTLDKQ